MAAAITVTCPECDTTIRASAEVEGKKVRCKSCGGVFVATAAAPAGAVTTKPGAKGAPKPAKPAPPPAAASPSAADDEEDENPYGVTEEDLTPRCPHCANELESAESRICLHCGYDTVTREQHRTKKTEDQTAGDVFLWLLPGILCVIGILFLIVHDVLYCMYIDEWVDTERWYGGLLASGFMKLWQVVISIGFMWMMAKFAVHRLIFDRVPPEVEKH
jgi:predicted Zn finger-like uncharacterized protein